MNWLFKIYKLKALGRLHRYNTVMSERWNGAAIDYSMKGEDELAFIARKQRLLYAEEAKKIENLIKFL